MEHNPINLWWALVAVVAVVASVITVLRITDAVISWFDRRYVKAEQLDTRIEKVTAKQADRVIGEIGKLSNKVDEQNRTIQKQQITLEGVQRDTDWLKRENERRNNQGT